MAFVLAYDIGGTTACAALVDDEDRVVGEPVQHELRSTGSLAEIGDDLQALTRACLDAHPAAQLAGIGVGLPGPTDLRTGTPWMRHKLRALYGRSLVPLLGRPDHPIAFCNDAEAMAIGEVRAGAGRRVRRLLVLTLGTGLGSAFVVDGRIVVDGPGVPPGGELWSQPFAGSGRTIDQEVGREGLEERYRHLGGDAGLSLRQVAARARSGGGPERALFEHLGHALAIAVAGTVREFGPERVILDGAIARSHGLFAPAMEQRLAELVGRATPVIAGQLDARGALVGAAEVLRRRVRRFARRRVIYLHGFASSPGSAKATRFVEALGARGVPVDVPDLNEGDFSGLTISRQLALLDRMMAEQPPGSVLLVGSSLGGYTAALQAARTDKVAALVLMAPAFDFARRWVARLGDAQTARWQREGAMPTMHFATGREAEIGWSLIEDARSHPGFPDVRVPTLAFHGRRDDTVDPELSVRFAAERENVELELLEADHGLADAIEHIVGRGVDFLSRWWA